MDAPHILSVSATPIVLISACGLITLALYNRLGSILARIRAFHQQKVELLNNLHEHESSEAQMLLGMLDSQINDVTAKARAIQMGLYCLLSANMALLLCSLFAAVGVFHESGSVVAIVMYVLGLALFLAGIAWAMRELSLSLVPLEEESGYLESLTTHHWAKAQDQIIQDCEECLRNRLMSKMALRLVPRHFCEYACQSAKAAKPGKHQTNS